MNRMELIRQDVTGIQAFISEFGPSTNGEARVTGVNRTGELLTLRNFPLPDDFSPDYMDALLVIANYPGRPPVGLYVLNRNNRLLMNRLEQVFNLFRDKAFHTAPAIPGYTWICYHYEEQTWRYNARNPATGDNLRKFLLSFYNACEHGVR